MEVQFELVGQDVEDRVEAEAGGVFISGDTLRSRAGRRRKGGPQATSPSASPCQPRPKTATLHRQIGFTVSCSQRGRIDDRDRESLEVSRVERQQLSDPIALHGGNEPGVV